MDRLSDRNKFMILGAVAGALIGTALAWAYYTQKTTGLWTSRREDGKTLTFQAGPMDFFRVGMAIFAVVRQIQSMVRTK